MNLCNIFMHVKYQKDTFLLWEDSFFYNCLNVQLVTLDLHEMLVNTVFLTLSVPHFWYFTFIEDINEMLIFLSTEEHSSLQPREKIYIVIDILNSPIQLLSNEQNKRDYPVFGTWST